MPTSEFRGWVLLGRWSLPVGGSTSLDVSAVRRPLPSNFNTFYIYNELRVKFNRRWLQYSRYGVELFGGRNVYGDALSLADGTPTICGDIIRKDRRIGALAYLEWLVHPRVGLRFSARHERRRSNCEAVDNGNTIFPVDYDATSLATRMRFGWF